jgi:hypothetical protein
MYHVWRSSTSNAIITASVGGWLYKELVIMEIYA